MIHIALEERDGVGTTCLDCLVFAIQVQISFSIRLHIYFPGLSFFQHQQETINDSTPQSLPATLRIICVLLALQNLVHLPYVHKKYSSALIFAFFAG